MAKNIMELSLVPSFDELRRCQDVLTDGTAEIGKRTQTFFNKLALIV